MKKHKKEEDRSHSDKLTKDKIPSTEGPLAEKDEVKQAERRTQKAQKDAKKR